MIWQIALWPEMLSPFCYFKCQKLILVHLSKVIFIYVWDHWQGFLDEGKGWGPNMTDRLVEGVHRRKGTRSSRMWGAQFIQEKFIGDKNYLIRKINSLLKQSAITCTIIRYHQRNFRYKYLHEMVVRRSNFNRKNFLQGDLVDIKFHGW